MEKIFERKKGKNLDEGRIIRLLRIIQDIRSNPVQSLEAMLDNHHISRAQFYKDRNELEKLGFRFEYRKKNGFKIVEDRLSPITGLSLSDRVILLFALEYLGSTSDGVLAAKALEVGRKLSGGLDQPFKEQLLQCFDREIMQDGYGAKPEIFAQLTQAISECRRVRMLYLRSGTWTESWRLVDPKRIYLRDRTLYLYARTVDETPPAWKVFRLNRIMEIEPTGITFTPDAREDDGFRQREKNAFIAFLGEKARKVVVKFTGDAVPYIRERKWHESQTLTEEPDGSLLMTVKISEPMEVVRWARQFGDNAQILEIEDEADSFNEYGNR